MKARLIEAGIPQTMAGIVAEEIEKAAMKDRELHPELYERIAAICAGKCAQTIDKNKLKT